MKNNIASRIRPSSRQLAWQQLEFYGFIHFGMNTMTGREWGTGTDSPNLFNPTKVDCYQWARALKSAGMTGAILTCKHHDGFCLWPSAKTTYSVAAAPWHHGQGDLVAEFAQACHTVGLKMGVYLSPWDRHEPTYGHGRAYDDFYVAQLTELLTNYGQIFEVWFDGANGANTTGLRQEYDWQRYYDTIRQLQPQAVIAVCGPDVRWIGNEGGQVRENEWSVVPASLQDAEKIAAKSQQQDNSAFRKKLLSTDEDLGSRQAIAKASKLVWYPAETDLSIRPGWFYHASEDNQVKSATTLFNTYCRTVGGNSTLLLNVPPTSEGLIAASDQQSLQELGQQIQQLHQANLLATACITTSTQQLLQTAQPLSFKNDSTDQPTLIATWEQSQVFNTVILKENIAHGQQIETYQLFIWQDEQWRLLYSGGVIGYQRILRLPQTTTTKLKLVVTGSRADPELIAVKLIQI